eukprot:CFRG6575T1
MWQQSQSVGGKERRAFLEKAAEDRAKREQVRLQKERKELEAAATLVVQRFGRRVIFNRKEKQRAEKEFDALFEVDIQSVEGTKVSTTTKNIEHSTRENKICREESVLESLDQSGVQVGREDAMSGRSLFAATETFLKLTKGESSTDRQRLQALLRAILTSMETHQPPNMQYLAMATSGRAAWIAQVTRLLGVVLHHLAKIRNKIPLQYNKRETIPGLADNFEVTLNAHDISKSEVSSHTTANVISTENTNTKTVLTVLQEERLYLHAVVILTDYNTWSVVKTNGNLGVLVKAFRALSREVMYGLVKNERYYELLGEYMKGVVASEKSIGGTGRIGMDAMSGLSMVTLSLRPILLCESSASTTAPVVSPTLDSMSGRQNDSKTALRERKDKQGVASGPGEGDGMNKRLNMNERAMPEMEHIIHQFVIHCLTVPCLIDVLKTHCGKALLRLQNRAYSAIIHYVCSTERNTSVKVDTPVRVSAGVSVDGAGANTGACLYKNKGKDITNCTGMYGYRDMDINNVLVLYGNLVALADLKQRTGGGGEEGLVTDEWLEQYVAAIFSLTKLVHAKSKWKGSSKQATSDHSESSSSSSTRSNNRAASEFHPILGMCFTRTNPYIKPHLSHIHAQIKRLWETKHLTYILMNALHVTWKSQTVCGTNSGTGFGTGKKQINESCSLNSSPSVGSATLANKISKGLAKNVLGGVNTFNHSSTMSKGGLKERDKLDLNAAMRVCSSCEMIHALPKAFPNDKHMIWNRIICLPNALSNLYRLLLCVGPSGGMAVFLHAAANKPSKEPMLSVLLLFCDCCTNLLVTLDDTDMYDEQKTLTLEEFGCIVRFLVRFIFNLVVVGRKKNRTDPAYKPCLRSSHSLLCALRDRDSARTFTTKTDWRLPVSVLSLRQIENILDIIKEGTQAHTHADTESVEMYNQLVMLMPHIIPFKRSYHTNVNMLPHVWALIHLSYTRVKLFRGYVERDIPLPSHSAPRVITVRRGTVLDDGFRQLRNWSTTHFKETFRVRYVNQLGQEEIGIDQHGVFKEFLEDVVVAAFDAELGLFASTDNRMYPSVLSGVQPDHLELFQFVGRMLGKAVYEGLIEDVFLAHFFLNKILGRYNFRNELPSLDAELDKNLRFIKSYKDVEDLGLTFSADEDIFGKPQTTDLVPGGSAIAVTNDNVIMYIYLMADHRMNKAIEKQSKAFVTGFTSVIKRSWLSLFSARDIQTLIAGDGVGGLDMENLMEYTQYVGGYSSGHRTIRNLWSVVKDDLSPEHQRLFLKFVTSCSRPPILGFQALQPPFTVALLPNDGENDRQTRPTLSMITFGLVGTVDTTRLPTASTCFNCLKLPPYKTKSKLKERLIYAITCKAGFELL